MPNVLKQLNQRPARKPSSSADLERAIYAADDARDLGKDILRSLPDADIGDDEPTANHNAPPAIPSIHVHLDSVHDSDPPAKKQIKAGLLALGTGIGVALMTGVVALLQKCGH
jgi:hypothetical protein